MKNPSQKAHFAFSMGQNVILGQDEIRGQNVILEKIKLISSQMKLITPHLLEIFIIIENIICHIKMKRLNLKTLRSIAKRLELRGYSKLRKSQLIDFIVAELDCKRLTPPPPPSARPPPPRKRPPKPTRVPPPRPPPPPPPPPKFKPYQLKAKRDSETFIEERSNTSIDPNKLKWMKKKLDELNRKIRAI